MSLERIEVTPFPTLVGEIIAARRTGTLTIIRDPVRKVLHWVEGELVLTTANSLHDSLGAYLFRRNLITDEFALQLTLADWTDTVPVFHRSGAPIRNKEAALRDWVTALTLPLFGLEDGTAFFDEGAALPEDRRVMMHATSLLVLEGVRSIRSGLVLRRSLGDVRREIEPARVRPFDLRSLRLTATEESVLEALKEREPIDTFIKRQRGDSADVGRAVILMLTLGFFTEAEEAMRAVAPPDSDPQRDLMLLAAIGAEDGRSLKAVALARQLPMMNHYELLKVPSRSTRMEIMKRAAELKKRFDPATFPPIVREYVEAIRRRIDEASEVLLEPARRQEYDGLLNRVASSHLHMTMQQRITRRDIAAKNYRKACELVAKEDFYAAIVLLKQAVDYAPEMADGWFLLGNCQRRNPQWLREATTSLQKALSINPNHIDALLVLGDLFKAEGLSSRAESCWEDVLQIDPMHAEALGRLKRKPPEERRD